MKVRRVKGESYDAFQKFIKDAEERKALKVGFLGDSEYPESDFPVAKAAKMSEFGFPKKNIPPRPYFRPAIAKNERKWGVYIYNQFKKTILGELEFWQAFERLGLVIKGDVVEAINAVHSPALKRATVRARYRRLHPDYKKTIDIKGILANKKARDKDIEQNKAPKDKPHSLEKPLVDTKIMLDSVNYIVEEPEE